MYLYAGKILKINLKTKNVVVEDLNQEWAQKFMGGKGLGFRYLYHEMDPSTDPLSPSNVLIFMTGPMAGTMIPSTSRVCMLAKSPATGTILDSYMGGDLAAEMKYAGYDAVIVKGKSEKPVYVVINDDTVEFKDARELWGKGNFETDTEIKKELGDSSYRTATIGPAGENQVPFAAIACDRIRHSGRGGIGAVMGSKMLKAIAVKGSKSIQVNNMEAFLEFVKKTQAEAVAEDNEPARDNSWVIKTGTPFLFDPVNELGVMPIRNFQGGKWEESKNISAEALDMLKKKDEACVACPLACGKLVAQEGKLVKGPEYETMALGGPNCGIDDVDAIIKFNYACDDLGLDTISAGNVIGWAMEMTERNVHDFGVRFGDRDNYLKLPYEIAFLRDRGKDLSLGVRKLSAKYGGQEFAMEVKGLEFPGYDPRGNYGMGLAYATADRGACHLRAYTIFHQTPFDLEAMPQAVVLGQHGMGIKDSWILCLFCHSVQPEEMVEALNIGLGTDIYDPAKLLEIGERIWNLGRLFNLKAGLTAKDDYLPPRIHQDGLLSGPHKGKMLSEEDFTKMLQSYYELRGWDTNGVPGKETLKRLKLDDLER